MLKNINSAFFFNTKIYYYTDRKNITIITHNIRLNFNIIILRNYLLRIMVICYKPSLTFNIFSFNITEYLTVNKF